MINPVINLNNTIVSLIEAHIADLHFGVMDPKVQYEILMEQFISKLWKLQCLDIISINGDIFDHKFMGNSEAIMYATMFVDEVVRLAKSKNSTVIIIHGTNSHDSSQTKIFYHYLSDKTVDVRIIERCQFEIVKGKRILCIPELYGFPAEYYRKLLFHSGVYDAVYMHGTLRGAIYGKNESILGSNREPVFSMDHFALCRGPIISGHNHIQGCHDSHFYYCGSPYRWQFGEEQSKGFLILLHNITNKEYYVNFEEITSFRYDTINLDSMINEDPKKVIEYVKELQANGIHNVKVKFTKQNEENLNIIKKYFYNSNSVKVEGVDQSTFVKQATEEVLDKYKEYDYMFDKNLKEEDILVRYINQCKGFQYITTEELLDILNDI